MVIVKFTRINAESIEALKRRIDLYGSCELGFAHFTGIDNVKRVYVRGDCTCKCECDCVEEQGHDHKTISMSYTRLTVICIKDV